jgi:hypothetical protein
LVLAIAAFLQPGSSRRRNDVGIVVAFPFIVSGLLAVLVALLTAGGHPFDWRLTLGACCLVAFVWFGLRGWPSLSAAAALATVCAGSVFVQHSVHLLAADRSFFGVYRVFEKAGGRFHVLSHGTTLHGQEDRSSTGCEPLSYYARSGPVGDVFAELARAGRNPRRVAVIGLGTGSLACYSAPSSDWTFYEIDPMVESIARNERYFSFLAHAPGSVTVVQGDARVSLAHAAGSYDVLVLDAFSSDAIPVHLLTQEAVRLYVSTLDPRGLLLVNISNRHLDLRPVVAALARDAKLVAFARFDDRPQPAGDSSPCSPPSLRSLRLWRSTTLPRAATRSRSPPTHRRQSPGSR